MNCILVYDEEMLPAEACMLAVKTNSKTFLPVWSEKHSPCSIKWPAWDWNLVLKKSVLRKNEGAGIFHFKIDLFPICRLVSFCSSYILHQHVVDRRLSLKFPDAGLEEAKNVTELTSLASGDGDLVAILFSTSCYLNLPRTLTFVTEVANSHLSFP